MTPKRGNLGESWVAGAGAEVRGFQKSKPTPFACVVSLRNAGAADAAVVVVVVVVDVDVVVVAVAAENLCGGLAVRKGAA